MRGTVEMTDVARTAIPGKGLLRLGELQAQKLLRTNALVLVLAAILVGATTGIVASSMVSASEVMHRWLFGFGPNTRLSSMAELPAATTLLALAFGGLIVGGTNVYWRHNARDIVDPIEANALHGGRMSLSDSLFVAMQSVLSSGFGLSLGIEGGFTQIAGAIGSRVGRVLRRRRFDVRVLVSAGAAGGIAGAFDAPFAGAAYGYELILGSYSIATLAPVVAAAVAGEIAAKSVVGHSYRIPIEAWNLGPDGHAASVILLGVLCGLIAIALMWCVTASERVARASRIPVAIRPLLGGVAVGAIAIWVPHVLGSGHGAMALVLQAGWPIALLAAVLIAKITASAISLGFGFRGGLFSTSLFLGTVTGALFGEAGVSTGSLQGADVGLMSLVGMASFGAAVIGSPLTMALLAIEITQNLSVIGPVLIGVVAASLTVRQVFGYSFATWRFHLRGEAILGGEDIGWTRETTAQNIMRRDCLVVPSSMSVVEFRSHYSPGSVKYAVVTGENAAYAGLVDLARLYAEPSTLARDAPLTLADVSVDRDAWVDKSLTIDRLLPSFDDHESEVLIVVDDATSRRVLGLVTEAYALKRYRLELEARQKEIFGT